MQKVICPYCGGEIYSAYFPDPERVICIYCKKEFFVGYDSLKQAWISTDPNSPLQAIFIQGEKKRKEGEDKNGERR